MGENPKNLLASSFKISNRAVSIGTTVTGVMTVASTGSTATGIAIGAAGATATYVTTKGIPLQGYERIKHVPPRVTTQRSLTNEMHKIRKKDSNANDKDLSKKIGACSRLNATFARPAAIKRRGA